MQLKPSLTLLMLVLMFESIVRRTLNSYIVNGGDARRKPLLSKKNVAACPHFGKDHMDKGKCVGGRLKITSLVAIRSVTFNERKTLHSSKRTLSHL